MLHDRTQHTDRPVFLIFLVLLVAVLAACGGSAAASFAPERPVTGTVSGAEPPGNGATPAPGGDGSAIGAVDDARIVRTGTMDLEVTDVNLAVSAARDLIRGMGGYIGASSTTNEDDRPLATITYRIPVDRWEDALAGLRGLNGLTKKVVAERTEAVEVTGQIVDLEARIRNLRASEAALQGIAAKAGKISDVLEVEAQLTNVRGQIEQLTAQLTDISGRADYATLVTTFATVIVAVDVAAKGWDPSVVVDEASASMVGILQELAGAGIWFAIVWLPILLVLAILAVAAMWVARRTGLLRRPVPPAPPAAPPPPAPIAVA
jgi:Domain of unknown function (DUF4349)